MQKIGFWSSEIFFEAAQWIFDRNSDKNAHLSHAKLRGKIRGDSQIFYFWFSIDKNKWYVKWDWIVIMIFEKERFLHMIKVRGKQ